jgi:DNA-binding transcriptional LysR family regulator
MELDLRQVRAFVAVADHGHFGRAARSLFLTQQALSKRVARLEEQLGLLLERGPAGVSLTERGERLLPAARQALEAADHALATALGEPAPSLRIDVWGPVDPPEAMLRAFAAEHPELIVEISMRRNLSAALDALRRNELDAAFGNLANHPTPLAAGLSAQLVAATPLAGLVSETGELATADVITPEDLRRCGLAIPDQTSRPEFACFVAEFAKAVDAPRSTRTRGLHLDGLIERVGTNSITLAPTDWAVPDGAGVRLVAVRPMPLFPWYVVWRTASRHPLVRRLLGALRRSGAPTAGVDADHWLPARVSTPCSSPP